MVDGPLTMVQKKHPPTSHSEPRISYFHFYGKSKETKTHSSGRQYRCGKDHFDGDVEQALSLDPTV